MILPRAPCQSEHHPLLFFCPQVTSQSTHSPSSGKRRLILDSFRPVGPETFPYFPVHKPGRPGCHAWQRGEAELNPCGLGRETVAPPLPCPQGTVPMRPAAAPSHTSLTSPAELVWGSAKSSFSLFTCLTAKTAKGFLPPTPPAHSSCSPDSRLRRPGQGWVDTEWTNPFHLPPCALAGLAFLLPELRIPRAFKQLPLGSNHLMLS